MTYSNPIQGARSFIRAQIKKRFPRVANAYRAFFFPRKDLEPRFVPSLGFQFASPNAEMQRGVFEPAETSIVRRLLDRVDTLVNVGANVGYYCCIALKLGKTCIAIEPDYDNLQLLQRNLVANGWEQYAKIFPVAVSEHAGIEELFGSGTGASMLKGWAGQTSGRLVPVHTLDSIVASHDGRLLILMDIEGHEMAALTGAQRLLAREPVKPFWIVEISIDEHWPDSFNGINPQLLETFDLFWKRGYYAYSATSELNIVSRDLIASIAASGQNALGTHNFIFTDLTRDELLQALDGKGGRA